MRSRTPDRPHVLTKKPGASWGRQHFPACWVYTSRPPACWMISGVFHVYRKLNPVRSGDMKASSIKKKLKEPSFAAKIDRNQIYLGCEHLGVTVDDHVANLIKFFAPLP